jgi:sarcosine oxidase subunit gamma
MQPIMQISPVAYAQPKLPTQWGVVNEMEIATEFTDVAIEQARKKLLGVTDVSCFQRYGVKGPQASEWLVNHELAIPSKPNSWAICKKKSLVLRLGTSEFLIEDLFGGYACSDLAEDTQRVAGVYQVPRADASFILSGVEVLNLFSELCALDLRDQALLPDAVIMTQFAGVSVTLLRQMLGDEQVYRLWCDGTYGPYMWEMLIEVAGELGGGAVGLSSY